MRVVKFSSKAFYTNVMEHTDCPTCKQKAGEICRTRSGKPAVMVHIERCDLAVATIHGILEQSTVTGYYE